MDLGGAWRAAEADDLSRRDFPDPDLDDSAWTEAPVPGHWRSVASLAASDGPVFYRRRFEAPVPPAGRRAWLRFDGVLYQGDIWLDGSYLGDTEGYFAPHTFEVTDALRARTGHLLAVEVTCAPVGDPAAKWALTGALQSPTWVDPAFNPGGIWAGVELSETGPVRIAALRVRCPDARPDHAALDVEVELDAAEAGAVPLVVVVRDDRGDEVARREDAETVAIGSNRVRRRLRIDRPRLWWPHALGAQPLHTVEVEVGDGNGSASDRRSLITGLRQVRMRGLVASVNGERLYLKGATYGPVRRELAEAPANRIAGDVAMAVDAGLDLLRVSAHVSRPELYDAADRAGLLLWQDLPLEGAYANVRRQAVRQAREAVTLLGHHPCILVWCGHDEPVGGDGGLGLLRRAATQAVPSWGRTTLDRSVRRALERSDGSRPVVGHSGVLPHPTAGTDSYLWFGWRDGDERDLASVLARWPVIGRFLGAFGAQAVPASTEWLDTSAWPAIDRAGLEAHHGAHLEVLERWVPPGPYATFDAWRDATQDHQAQVVRRTVETLRRLKYRPTGGFTVHAFADAQPAIGFSLLDHRRAPKAGWEALRAACAPVIVVADHPADSYRAGERVRLAVHAVSDRRSALEAVTLRARLAWDGGERTWAFSGDIPADAVVRIATLEAPAPDVPGELRLDLALRWDGGEARNTYHSVVTAELTAELG